jgi:hypothetical protein
MTGMAANPLVVTKAKLVFPGIEFNFVTWILGASVPALATLLMMPILFMWWCNADRHVGSGEQVKQLVNDQLFDLGAMAACEKVSIT